MKCRRSAFTLIEVLIVVVIMAVLAATIIPQFSSSTEDAKESSMKFNLHTLRSQIELYKIHHLGNYPEISDADLPQLTSATNVSGVIGTAGPNYPYGPYITGELPANPFDGSNTVTAVSSEGVKPTTPVGSDGGWLYDESNGSIWPNDAQGLALYQ